MGVNDIGGGAIGLAKQAEQPLGVGGKIVSRADGEADRLRQCPHLLVVAQNGTFFILYSLFFILYSLKKSIRIFS